MDNLKKFFSCSSDSVIFTDYKFNILWKNKAEIAFVFNDENCSELFKDETLPLKSGTYYVKHIGYVFECKVTNYSEFGDGIYVIQSSDDDVVFSAIKCQTIRNLLENHSSNYRAYATGINLAGSVVREILIDHKLYDKLKYIDIISGDCRKMLKLPSCLNELIQYANGSINIQKINILKAFTEFSKKSNKILKEKARVEIEIKPDLYINADFDRLEAFFIAIIAFVNGKESKNNIIKISAEQISKDNNDEISITVFSESMGIDSNHRTFSENIELHKGDEVDWNLLIINRFCQTFNGTLFISGNSDDSKILGIKFPICDNHNEPVKFETSQKSYQDNQFSKYNIMFSDMLY